MANSVGFFGVPARVEWVAPFLDHVRPEDRMEWVGGTGHGLRIRLTDAVLHPRGFARAVFREDLPEYPLLFWGADPVIGFEEAADVWLIASEDAMSSIHGLHRLLPKEMAILDAGFTQLRALADMANVTHLQWLKWLGFKPGPVQSIGPWKRPYQSFIRMVPDVR